MESERPSIDYATIASILRRREPVRKAPAPTKTIPGSPQKVEVLVLRQRLRQHLWHSLDAGTDPSRQRHDFFAYHTARGLSAEAIMQLWDRRQDEIDATSQIRLSWERQPNGADVCVGIGVVRGPGEFTEEDDCNDPVPEWPPLPYRGEPRPLKGAA